MPDQNKDLASPISTEEHLRSLISHAVKDTLTSLGVDAAEPLEMQKDFQHLREWRKSTDKMKQKGLLAIVGLFVAGSCALALMGLKAYFK